MAIPNSRSLFKDYILRKIGETITIMVVNKCILNTKLQQVN